MRESGAVDETPDLGEGLRKYNLLDSNASRDSHPLERSTRGDDRTAMVQTARMLKDRGELFAAAGSFQQGFQQKLCVTGDAPAGHRPKFVR